MIIEMTDEIKDRAASAGALERDRHHCRIGMPGCNGQAGAVHHIFPRSILSVRWFQLNMLSVCWRCHEWAHSNPENMTKLVQDALMSSDEWKELLRRKEG